MNYEQLADEFIEKHQGVGYQSNPQMIAIRAFAKWLSAQQDETLRELARQIESGFCMCHIAYKERGLFDPNCQAHEIADFVLERTSPTAQDD